jgi:S-DNA-T family DNA segregation ATPase FtsK/SpoIIIE
MKGFISKPEGSNRWDIQYDLIDQQLSELGANAPEEELFDTVYK